MKNSPLNLNFSAEKSATLDRVLKVQLPLTEPPEALHSSIMQAVLKASRFSQEMPALWPRWIAPAGVACAVVMAVAICIQFSNKDLDAQKPDVPALVAADSVVELGGSIVRDAPAAAISPLTDEMQRMNHDLERTEQFLIASLP